MNGLPQNIIPASQVFFGGLITQVITGTNDPGYKVGQIFSGYYQYASGTADGTFHPNTSVNPTGNKSLTGIIYLPFPGASRRYSGLPRTPNPCTLTVTGGRVSGFDWTFQGGDYYAFFLPATFTTRLMGQPGGTVETTGSILFGPSMIQN